MTDKKEKILNSALELFAKEGYAATSTSKIAKHAGVSEGLIFRHFENKEGLLQAIMFQGEEKSKVLFADILMETEPKSIIRKIIELGYKTSQDEEEANYWKLQYKIKWEIEDYGAHKMEPIERALTHAFKELGYKNPNGEALVLLTQLDGMATRIFLQSNFNAKAVVELLKQKYEV